MNKTRNNLPRRLSAFTLIELLMVIAIISLLAGLIVIAGNQVKNSVRKKNTLTVLMQLKAAAEDYEIRTGRRINHMDSGTFNWSIDRAYNNPAVVTFSATENHYKWGSNTPWLKSDELLSTFSRPLFNPRTENPVDNSIERFLWVILRSEKSSSLLPVNGSDGRGLMLDTDDDGFLEMTDPFGGMIEYAESVVHGPDLSGNNYTPDDILPQRNTPFFVSSGADKDFGDASGTPTPALDDNIRSFDLP